MSDLTIYIAGILTGYAIILVIGVVRSRKENRDEVNRDA